MNTVVQALGDAPPLGNEIGLAQRDDERLSWLALNWNATTLSRLGCRSPGEVAS